MYLNKWTEKSIEFLSNARIRDTLPHQEENSDKISRSRDSVTSIEKWYKAKIIKYV